MFVLGLLGAMLVWAAMIVGLVRRREALIAEMRTLARGRRAREAMLRLFGSVLALGLAMALLAQGGLTPKGFTLGGWIATTALGGLFVFLQTTGLVPLALNAVEPVTRRDAGSSDSMDVDHP